MDSQTDTHTHRTTTVTLDVHARGGLIMVSLLTGVLSQVQDLCNKSVMHLGDSIDRWLLQNACLGCVGISLPSYMVTTQGMQIMLFSTETKVLQRQI